MAKKENQKKDASGAAFVHFEYPKGRGPALFVPLLGVEISPGEVFGVDERVADQIEMFGAFQRTEKPISNPAFEAEDQSSEPADEGGPETQEEK